MKVKLAFLTAFLFILFSADSLFAQDIIHLKKKQDPVQAKVIEIGTGEIKYKLWEEREDGLVYVVEKMNVAYIEFANGRTEYFGKELMDVEEYFQGQDKRALKISFLTQLRGSTILTYEQNISPGRSWEVRAVIVGLGFNAGDRDAKGFIGAVGYKFYKKPTFITADTRRRHILQGAYIKPEVFIGRTTFDTGPFGAGDQRETDTTVGLLLNLGWQWILGEKFVVNVVGGLGYGGGGDSHRSYLVDDVTNVAGTFSVDVGFTF